MPETAMDVMNDLRVLSEDDDLDDTQRDTIKAGLGYIVYLEFALSQLSDQEYDELMDVTDRKLQAFGLVEESDENS